MPIAAIGARDVSGGNQPVSWLYLRPDTLEGIHLDTVSTHKTHDGKSPTQGKTLLIVFC